MNIINIQILIRKYIVREFTISEREQVNITINANELAAGVYTYFLIGDGEKSDVMQMILAK